jgi:putative endonuclease
MNFTLYVLESIYYNHYYIGQIKNIKYRLKLHNLGKVKSTKRFKPWKLVYKEEFNSREIVVKREKYLKSHSGRKWLKRQFMGP